MDAIVNYGSDDESSDKNPENKILRSDELKTLGKTIGGSTDDANYDVVQMDMSEESDSGQRKKAEGERRSCSGSSSRSSSTEDEDEVSFRGVKQHGPTTSVYSEKYKEDREKSRRSHKQKKREGSHRWSPPVPRDGSPGMREGRSSQRESRGSGQRVKQLRKERRSRSKDRGKMSKEKRRNRDMDRDERKRDRNRDRTRYHSDRRRSRSRSPHHHRHHYGHHEEDRHAKKGRGHSPSKTHQGDESRSVEAKKATAVSRAVAAAAANIAAAVAAATEATTTSSSSATSSCSSLKNEVASQSNSDDGTNPSVNTKSSQQALMEGLGLQVEGSLNKTGLTSLSASLITPQLLVQRSLEIQASQSAGAIPFPSYYNPAAMNPLKYAEQMQKRKKLWGGSNKDNAKDSCGAGSGSTNNWESTTFAQDEDGKLSAKFKRLMGIKEPGVSNVTAPANSEMGSQSSEDVIKKQEELFSTMERQYEAARLATHTLRGVGLGFGSSSAYQYPR